MGHADESTTWRVGLTRRQFLKGGLIAAVGLATVPWLDRGANAPSPPLRKYVDRLRVPGVAQPRSIVKGMSHYTVQMTEFQQQVHRDLPPTTLWGAPGAGTGTCGLRPGVSQPLVSETGLGGSRA